MAEIGGDEHTIDDLIAALERAPAGSAALDRMVAFQLGLPLGESDQMIKLLLFEGYSWDVISELVQSEDPRFTTALDARIPGENIVLAMHSAKRDQWAAMHLSAGGVDFIAWAATEPLARRAAALRGLRAVSAFGTQPAAATQAEPAGPASPESFAAETESPASPAAEPRQGHTETERREGEPDPASLPPGYADGVRDNGEWKILF